MYIKTADTPSSVLILISILLNKQFSPQTQTITTPQIRSTTTQPSPKMKLSALLVLSTATLALTKPTPPPTCGVCNPISGVNGCDITTSCINTGTRFHCACRAGYKASKKNNDVTKQFRLPMPDYEFLVFTPEYTTCDTLCDNPYGSSKDLCKEVPVYDKCAV
ncbi:hypothetical protein BDV11DRAFT_177266 [Aspergillus similis]